MNMRMYWRNELARCINCARYATVRASKPGYDREGCKRTAYGYIIKAIEARGMISGFKLP